MSIEIRPLARGDWKTLERLFGENGACGGCWCMTWRVERLGKTWEAAKGAVNRERLRALVRRDAVHAMIAYLADEAIGWCSFGPRASFPRIESSRALRCDSAPGTWSIVCFFIPARWRGQRVATRLLAAATQNAFELGARAIEGYPAVPYGEDERIPAAFAWTGVPALFEKNGYRRVKREDGARPIYLREAPRSRGRTR